MPSRAEIRGTVEGVLRGVSFLILAWMLWLAIDRGRPETVVASRSPNLTASLRDWTSAGIAPHRISVQLDSTPTPTERDWLAALRGSGSRVSWNGKLTPVAVSSQRVAAPRGGYNVLAAAIGAQPVRISDEIGALDTAQAQGGGVRFAIPAATGFIAARSGGSIAKAPLADSVRIRRVLVLGSAGWEAKFVVAALEEDGWIADAVMFVAPGVSVTQGSTSPIDTARYSAVIALDGSAASRAGEINRYVASGGGLVIAGAAAAIDGFGGLRPGAPGRIEAPAALSTEAGTTTLRSLAVYPVTQLKQDGIALERRGSLVLAAGRRHAAGRVLQQGYADTWRWRMSGGDASADEHRAWWTRAVASVAYAPSIRAPNGVDSLDAAPVANLVATLGAPTEAGGPGLASAATSISLWWLFAALTLCLMAEWASRRLRGMK